MGFQGIPFLTFLHALRAAAVNAARQLAHREWGQGIPPPAVLLARRTKSAEGQGTAQACR